MIVVVLPCKGHTCHHFSLDCITECFRNLVDMHVLSAVFRVQLYRLGKVWPFQIQQS